MAYKRGRGTVQVELARLQDWAERMSEKLEGDFGEKGLIEQHEEMLMREATETKQNNDAAAFWTRICAGICAIPAILTTINFIAQHWPK